MMPRERQAARRHYECVYVGFSSGLDCLIKLRDKGTHSLFHRRRSVGGRLGLDATGARRDHRGVIAFGAHGFVKAPRGFRRLSLAQSNLA